jgi:hypothetical protein
MECGKYCTYIPRYANKLLALQIMLETVELIKQHVAVFEAYMGRRSRE